MIGFAGYSDGHGKHKAAFPGQRGASPSYYFYNWIVRLFTDHCV